MAKIFVTDNEYAADIKVFKTEFQTEAHLWYSTVHYENDANISECWLFVDAPDKATTKIFWVDKEEQADLIVFEVPFGTQYWNNCSAAREL